MQAEILIVYVFCRSQNVLLGLRLIAEGLIHREWRHLKLYISYWKAITFICMAHALDN